jgi:hypothetical protein
VTDPGELDAGGPRHDGGAPPGEVDADVTLDAGAPNDAGSTERDARDCVVYDEHCYRMPNAERSWPSAEADCASWGGHLVTLEDADEESWLLQQFGSDLQVWIGLNDRSEEGEWVWVSGSGSEWRHWASGEPDMRGPDEDCVMYDSSRLGWDDRKCVQGKAYVCEKPDDG